MHFFKKFPSKASMKRFCNEAPVTWMLFEYLKSFHTPDPYVWKCSEEYGESMESTEKIPPQILW